MKYLLIIALMICSFQQTLASDIKKARLIVTTDLGGSDPDDAQSLIHLLVCSNVIDIEGIISNNAWIDAPDNTDKINEIIKKFEEVLPNISKHEDGYPTAGFLSKIVRRGQEKSNMTGVGDNMDSPGSELIISAIDNRNDNRPIWIAAWGGINTLAQALWKIKNTRSKKEIESFTSKLRIYDILGQDDAGAWIAKNFPNIKYIRNTRVYGWAPDDKWISQNIQCIKPLGEAYPHRIWASEGDSPSFLYLCANGLNEPEHIDYGGWGGRFNIDKTLNVQGMEFIAQSGKDEMQYSPYYMHTSAPEGVEAIRLWQQHIFNDFAARMLWTTTDNYALANHHPNVIVKGYSSRNISIKEVTAGEYIKFDASESSDPDGNNLSYNWMIYDAPGTYSRPIQIINPKSGKCNLKIPKDASAQTIHLILCVTDDGIPALTSYKRFILKVK